MFIFIFIILIPFCSLFFLVKPLNTIFVMGNNSFELMNNIDATNLLASLKNVKKNI
ncbi:hypothetical protein CLTEP_26520 [Clostridium tepidiprofundi DSM 19306]|uniref:Uncharacterized protein n=1 Tax=Clostridium tepidiprofundi DSM 19306 TaxID=1121338 RepID=A0A151AS42_9CLOT|nr:hypothetical protein CLTEP_26520 [Clostridium tepidiprofundi DSM 19306]